MNFIRKYRDLALGLAVVGVTALCIILGDMIVRSDWAKGVPEATQDDREGFAEKTEETKQPEQTPGQIINEPYEKGTLQYETLGTYRNPVHIRSGEGGTAITFDEEKRLKLPECDVESVQFCRCGDIRRLADPDEDMVTELVETIQSVKFKAEEIWNGDGLLTGVIRGIANGQRDAEVGMTLRLNDGKKVYLSIQSYLDDYVEVIAGEDSENTGLKEVCYSAFSERLHAYLRNLLGVKTGSIDLLRGATNVVYRNSKAGWSSLTSDKIDKLIGMLNASEVGQNYSTGCPFNAFFIYNGGIKYKGYYTTDSCGYIVLEDRTYKVPKDMKRQLTEVFDEAWSADSADPTLEIPQNNWWPEDGPESE